LQSPERQDQPVPAHPNAGKENAIKARGDHPIRLAMRRFDGVDLTRIEGIRAGAAQTVLTEIGSSVASFRSEDHFVSWLRLCPPRTPISGGKPLKKRRNSLGANRIAGVLRMAAVSLQRSKTALGLPLRDAALASGLLPLSSRDDGCTAGSLVFRRPATALTLGGQSMVGDREHCHVMACFLLRLFCLQGIGTGREVDQGPALRVPCMAYTASFSVGGTVTPRRCTSCARGTRCRPLDAAAEELHTVWGYAVLGVPEIR